MTEEQANKIASICCDYVVRDIPEIFPHEIIIGNINISQKVV